MTGQEITCGFLPNEKEQVQVRVAVDRLHGQSTVQGGVGNHIPQFVLRVVSQFFEGDRLNRRHKEQHAKANNLPHN